MISKTLTLVFETKPQVVELVNYNHEGPEPRVYIKSISSRGLVTLRFDQNMLFDDDL